MLLALIRMIVDVPLMGVGAELETMLKNESKNDYTNTYLDKY